MFDFCQIQGIHKHYLAVHIVNFFPLKKNFRTVARHSFRIKDTAAHNAAVPVEDFSQAPSCMIQAAEQITFFFKKYHIQPRHMLLIFISDRKIM